MTLSSLSLSGFRNLADARFSFSPGVNLVTGKNGQGKTNLLEAIFYLSSVKSFRGARDRELIGRNVRSAFVEGVAEGGTRPLVLRAELSAAAPRVLSINGIRKKRVSDFAGGLPAVVFFPDDLLLVKGGPVLRRRLMDQALCQLRPRYADLLSEYNRVLDMKARTLRDLGQKPSLEPTVDVYNRRLSDLGAELLRFRSAYALRLGQSAAAFYDRLTGEKERFSLEYQTVSAADPSLSPAENAARLYNRLTELYKAELAGGTCLSGVHRDDLAFFIDGFEAKSFASQGQTRGAALSLKLAERELFERELGYPPLLLLDDVLSEFDVERRDFVLNRIDRGQVFITCCDDSPFSALKAGKILKIEAGRVKEESELGGEKGR